MDGMEGPRVRLWRVVERVGGGLESESEDWNGAGDGDRGGMA